MASTLTDVFSGSLKTILQWTRTDTQDVGSVVDKATQSTLYRIGEGSGAGQADLVFSDTRSIPAGQFESLDLLSLTHSEFGVSVPYVFRQLRVIRIVNNETATGRRLLVGVDPGRPTSVYATSVGPGSEMVAINQTDSWVVTTSNAALRLANPNGSALSYTIVLIGTATAAA